MTMKSKFLILPALCFGLVFSSCDTDRRTAQGEGYEQTEEGVGDGTEYGVETERTSAGGMEEDTRNFVEEAASSSMMEVELAQLAQEKAQSQDVKDYAQMIENDHKQANDRLRSIAQNKNITLPAGMKEDHREEIEDLRDKSGQEFDQEYMDKMVSEHEDDISKFEDMREDVQDTELRSWIDNTLTTLREHRDEAERIKERIGGNDGLLNN